MQMPLGIVFGETHTWQIVGSLFPLPALQAPARGLSNLWNLPKVWALVWRYRGNGDLKCSAKNDVCRMVSLCDAITVEKHSA
jgi:hypothetical protein